ncbi:MAG: taurine catabolism dioxygenase TauD [Gammaproteobacteria bacterium]|nr:taurine catabolism dioxygenase TauD [Gammaproteobacteria bacterium]
MKPFELANTWAYQHWREQKLDAYPNHVTELVVDVNDINCLTPIERAALQRCCRKTNMVIYRSQQALVAKDGLQVVCASFGLNRLDKNLYADQEGISALQVSTQQRKYDYIPYSENAIKWHTDGYYNELDAKIRAMVLHCVSPARQGGENTLLDHEVVYLLMRDANPGYIAALMQADVMTIPANIEDGKEIRAAQTGPVFSIDQLSGDLQMRYTSRTRSIHWKRDNMVQSAVRCLEDLLMSDLPAIFTYRLSPNEGILSNNVLHSRTAFKNGPHATEQRLIYRARYYDRIRGTSVFDAQ